MSYALLKLEFSSSTSSYRLLTVATSLPSIMVLLSFMLGFDSKKAMYISLFAYHLVFLLYPRLFMHTVRGAKRMDYLFYPLTRSNLAFVVALSSALIWMVLSAIAMLSIMDFLYRLDVMLDPYLAALVVSGGLFASSLSIALHYSFNNESVYDLTIALYVMSYLSLTLYEGGSDLLLFISYAHPAALWAMTVTYLGEVSVIRYLSAAVYLISTSLLLLVYSSRRLI